jgi:polyisoprenoid-binding protein YceI
MNIKPSANVPALSGKRSVLRRAITTAVAASALMLGIASAQAGDDNSFTVKGTAAAGTVPVEGKGKFDAKFDGDKLVLTVKVANLDMGMRKGHTRDAFKIKDEDSIKITVDKSKLTMPEEGKEASGEAPGSLTIGGKTKDVKIKYSVKGEKEKFVIKSASFSFDYTAFSGSDICMPVVKTPCVAKQMTVSASGSVKRPK